jgi:uncharacterized protein
MRIILDTNVIISGIFFGGVPPLEEPACEDPDDDKFLACALAADVDVIVSGDKALLKLSGYRGIHVLAPGRFVQSRLSDRH